MYQVRISHTRCHTQMSNSHLSEEGCWKCIPRWVRGLSALGLHRVASNSNCILHGRRQRRVPAQEITESTQKRISSPCGINHLGCINFGPISGWNGVDGWNGVGGWGNVHAHASRVNYKSEICGKHIPSVRRPLNYIITGPLPL